MHDIIIYVARWWEKYLSKGSPLKHTCSWRDKLIILCILNRQAKIFLCMADLHYIPLNILSLICYYSDYYCFCDKYQGCEKDYYIWRDLYPLCRIKIYFRHDLVNFGEYLDRNQFNLTKLKAYAFKLYPFLIECYHVDKRSLEAFSRHYVWSCCDQYTGQKSELTLKEIVKENIKLKKLNGEEKYFRLFY